jgi:hypothetical protein
MIGCLMDNELEGMWKEAVVALLKVLFRHLPGGTEENYDKPQAWYRVSET